MVDELRSIFNEFLTFAPNPEPIIGHPPPDEVRRWIQENPDSWRLSNEALFRNLAEVGTLLLIGEEGEGKTTALLEFAESIMNTGALLVRIDFSNNDDLVHVAKKNYAGALGANITRQLRMQLTKEQDYRQYSAALKRMLFSGEVGKLGNQDERLRLSDEFVQRMTDDEVLSSRQISEALQGITLGERSRTWYEFRAFQAIPDRKIYLQVDNIDHLERGRIPVTLEFLQNLIQKRTHVQLAMRPETEPLYVDYRHLIVPDRIPMNSGDRINSIVELRLKGAETYIRQHRPELRQAADRAAKQHRKNWQLIRSEPPVRRLVTDWHNGNLRAMLAFAQDLADEYIPEATNRSLEGVVYSRLIRNATPNNLLSILDPGHIYVKKYPDLPFVFLNLRVLAFLDARGGPTTVRDFQRTLRREFGVPESSVRDALTNMATRLGTGGAPISLLGPVTKGDTEVRLMPSGRLFINQVVFSCEFLAWVYDRAPGFLESVDPQMGQQTKLDKSVAVIKGTIFPAFVEEHPYLNRNRPPTDLERDRLVKYVKVFHYGPKRWFIGRLRADMIAFAERRRLVESRLNPLCAELDNAVKRLDDIYRGKI